MPPSRFDILRLYKNLLRYCDIILLTDKNYLKSRIRDEFKKNKNEANNIDFLYKVFVNFLKTCAPYYDFLREKKSLNKSFVPKLNEKDLKETFIKGHGPGGSKVNKSVNCVLLSHMPTGLQVKVHEHRELKLNRDLARSKLITLLDNLQNGENSIENQTKKIFKQTLKKKLKKQKKLADMKAKWRTNL